MLKINSSYIYLILPFILISQGLAVLSVILISLITLSKIILTKNYSIFKNKIIIYLILFNLYILISSFFSNNILISLESSIFYFRFIFFAIFISLIVNKKKDLKLFLYSLIFLVLFISIDGIFQYFSNYNLFGIEKNEEHTGRISGIFGEELVLGSFIARIYPIVLGLSFLLNKEKIFLYSKYGIVIYIIFLLGILVSGDRTALIYFLGTTILMTIFLRDFRKIFLIVISLSTLIILLIISINPSFKVRLIDRTLNEDLNISAGLTNINLFTTTHEEHYKTAILVFKQSPIIGVGPRMFREECKNYKEIYFWGCSTHPHNNLLQILSEIGVIGFLFYLLAIMYILVKLFIGISKVQKNHHDQNEIIVKNFMLILILISIQPLFPSSNFFGSYINTLYYIPLGIYLGLIKN